MSPGIARRGDGLSGSEGAWTGDGAGWVGREDGTALPDAFGAPAFLFDAYPHPSRSSLLLWIHWGDQVLRREVPFQPDFCVRAEEQSLDVAQKLLAKDSRVDAMWRSSCRLWLEQGDEEVLRVRTKHMRELHAVAQDLRRRTHCTGFLFFDVDHQPESRWLWDQGLWPLCRLKVGPEGPELALHPSEERLTDGLNGRWRVDHEVPALRIMQLEVTATNRGIERDLEDDLESIEISGHGGHVRFRVGDVLEQLLRDAGGPEERNGSVQGGVSGARDCGGEHGNLADASQQEASDCNDGERGVHDDERSTNDHDDDKQDASADDDKRGAKNHVDEREINDHVDGERGVNDDDDGERFSKNHDDDKQDASADDEKHEANDDERGVDQRTNVVSVLGGEAPAIASKITFPVDGGGESHVSDHTQSTAFPVGGGGASHVSDHAQSTAVPVGGGGAPHVSSQPQFNTNPVDGGGAKHEAPSNEIADVAQVAGGAPHIPEHAQSPAFPVGGVGAKHATPSNDFRDVAQVGGCENHVSSQPQFNTNPVDGVGAKHEVPSNEIADVVPLGGGESHVSDHAQSTAFPVDDVESHVSPQSQFNTNPVGGVGAKHATPSNDFRDVAQVVGVESHVSSQPQVNTNPVDGVEQHDCQSNEIAGVPPFDDAEELQALANHSDIPPEARASAERTILRALGDHIIRHDPDVIMTRGGDAWDIPYLLHRIKHHDLRHQVRLGRDADPNPGAPDQEGKSMSTYGRILWKSSAWYLRGRWHIDLSKKSLDAQEDRVDLWSILYMSRVSNRRPQDINRNGAGYALQQMQIDEARARGVALPWKRNLAEDWKDAATLTAVDRGGQIMNPKPGLYGDVAACDFSGYYPAIVVRHNLSSDTINCPCCPDGPVVPELNYHVCTKRRGHQASILERVQGHRRWAKAIIRRAKGERG